MRTTFLSFFLATLATTAYAGEPPGGLLPMGADGRALNFDFETGDLRDWTAEGDAFKGQPIEGDAVSKRRKDMKSAHQGRFWIGGYERLEDKPQGTLTSSAFKVTHPWASFLIGGGPYDTTCVELVRKDSGAVFHRASGLESERMEREVVNLERHLGKEIFIRVVDRHSGHWGHVNFDDFRFHSQKPAFLPRKTMPGLDQFKFAGLPPEKAAAAMTVPEGFDVTLFAGEPDVKQPIAFCLDDRGRLWVAEAYSYPIRRPDNQAKDRILIFEDTDGDGRFDKRTVFYEGLNLVSGLEVGFGGVWVGAAPYLLFIPRNAGEDKPSGPPQVLLDGWAYQDTHETLNTFTWGPDGWLYGCHGVFTHSKVGKPGTPDDQRVKINAGVWRYHPTRHLFEVFAHGTSNPWGLDFNDVGEAFCEACVIPHCYHIIQNGRYQRQAGPHFNPYTYDDIKTIADHFHYVGATPHSGNNRSDTAGGGHAHCGTMIYLGGAWPKEYWGKMFMGNIHGRRLNVDVLRSKGSGYVAGHGPDFLFANDAWARFINFKYGPDGNVYLIDWYDQQACHTNNAAIWDRSNGRIYSIRYRGTKPVQVDLAKLSNGELVKLQLGPNDWYVRHARRLLQERKPGPAVHDALAAIAFDHPDETRRLRGLWALHASGALDERDVDRALGDASPHVRGWSIQLVLEQGEPSEAFVKAMTRLAQADPSPIVRRYLASGLARLRPPHVRRVLEGLVRHAEDAADHNLPLLYWYAAEPLAAVDPAMALTLASESAVPPLLAFMVRRITSGAEPGGLQTVAAALGAETDVARQKIYLRGLSDGLKGRRQVPAPPAWSATSATLTKSSDAEVRGLAQKLAVTFGDAGAFAHLRDVLTDSKEAAAARQEAIATLVAGGAKDLAPLLQKLVADPAVRGAALRGLAAYDDPGTAGVVLETFAKLPADEKRDALNTLAARPKTAAALLDAVAAKKVAASDVPAEIVRQIHNLGDAALDKRIGDVWGVIRTTPADRLKLIGAWKRKLTAPGPKPNPEVGRAIFAKTCQQCHTLFGTGGKVGPDITGANRGSLDYLLENILDPSAVIPKEYAASVVGLTDGRVLTGIVRGDNPATLTLIMPGGPTGAAEPVTLTVPRGDVEFVRPSNQSMMPENLLQSLSDNDVRALIAYLQSSGAKADKVRR